MKKLRLLTLLICMILCSCVEKNNVNKNIEKNVMGEASETSKQMIEREKIIIGETESVKKDEDIKKNTDKKYIEGEVIVVRKKGYGDVSQSKEELLRNAKIIFTFGEDNENQNETILLVQDKNFTTEELIKKLKDLPEVISVEPNYSYDINFN